MPSDPRSRSIMLMVPISLAFLLTMVTIPFIPSDANPLPPSVSTDGRDFDIEDEDITGPMKLQTGKRGGQNLLTSRLLGRILGFVGLILLIMLVPTGGAIRSVCRSLNKAFGKAKNRVRFHCYASWSLLVISIVHAAVLMYGHYRDVMWGGFFLMAEPGNIEINLGFFSLMLMIAVSVLGTFQKRTCKAVGHKNWRRAHGWLTWSALILVIVHLLWVGTTSLPLREMLA